jgi:CRP-like cAMP-binding protein
MQETLSNIISGIALEIGKPFKVGDWLVVEGQHAEVVEVNWRSTKLRTNDDIYLDIPNKAIVGSTIRNLTYPTRQHGIRLRIGFEYSVPPNFVKDCLQHATVTAFGVATQPPPKVFLKDFGDSAIIYEIKFTMEDEARYNDICDSIRTNIWYEAQRHGLRIPFPIRTLQIDRRKPDVEDPVAAARMSARKQPILQLLDDAQFDKLLHCARLQRFGRGEKVIVQGECGQSMFIVLAGEAEVLVRAGGAETRVATLRTGDAFGEMSLLTGEPRSATVLARTDCELWEIDKTTLGEILQENAALVERLGELLARRRLENEGLLATVANPREMATKQLEYKQGFLRKLSVFFEL